MRVYIARHGQDEDNKRGVLNGWRDMPLTQDGEKQAHVLAEEIRELNIRFDAVFTSPLQRARRTAEIISSVSHQPEPIDSDLLIERNFGKMTGVEINKIEDLCLPDILRTDTVTYFLNAEGAETFPDLLERSGKLLKYLRENYLGKSLLLVTHGDIGKMIFAKFYALPWRKVLIDFHFGNSEMLYLEDGYVADSAHIFKKAQLNW